MVQWHASSRLSDQFSITILVTQKRSYYYFAILHFDGIPLGAFIHSTPNSNTSNWRGKKWRRLRKLSHLMEQLTITWLNIRARMSHRPHMERGQNSTKVDVKELFCIIWSEEDERERATRGGGEKKVFFRVRNFFCLFSTFFDLYKFSPAFVFKSLEISKRENG